MQPAPRVALSILAALALGACEDRSSPPPKANGAGTSGHTHAPGGDHVHTHGDEHNLGSATIGAYEVTATSYGHAAPGKELDVDIRLKGDPAPAAIRAWIGAQDASGSIKTRAEAESDHFHAHVEAPAPIPQDARLWIEIEAAGGQTSTGSFPLTK